MESFNETAPLRAGQRPFPYMPMDAAGRTFGTTFFLISVLIASIIPIVQLTLGLNYKGACPIDQRIPTYMTVAGICGLVLVGLAVLLALTFMCLISDSATLTIMAACAVCLNMAVTVIISVFVFIWFIIGCVWVFRAAKHVQFDIRDTPTYCNPVLYKWTFALLILTIVWACLQCCVSCLRQCFNTRNTA